MQDEAEKKVPNFWADKCPFCIYSEKAIHFPRHFHAVSPVFPGDSPTFFWRSAKKSKNILHFLHQSFIL